MGQRTSPRGMCACARKSGKPSSRRCSGRHSEVLDRINKLLAGGSNDVKGRAWR